MSWLQLHTQVNPAQVPLLEGVLEDCGAISVTFQDLADQPIFEPGVGETPLWASMRATALFDASASKQAINAALEREFSKPALPCEWELLEDRDWERTWLDHFAPLRCGARLWVCPSWHEPPDPAAVNIMLDPGLAFGTGTHETTKLCLQWLDQAELDDSRVLDFGCGSGILGIGALLLGARHLTLVDNDPQALTASAANLEKNHCSPSAYTLCHANDFDSAHAAAQIQSEGQTNAQLRAPQFDLILANILAGPLIDLSAGLCRRLPAGGQLVLSGIREEQQAMVEAAYQQQIEFRPAIKLNGWLCLYGVKT